MSARGPDGTSLAPTNGSDILSNVAGKFGNAANRRPMVIAPVGAKFFAAETGFAGGANNVLDHFEHTFEINR